jgi:hypothetical protein
LLFTRTDVLLAVGEMRNLQVYSTESSGIGESEATIALMPVQSTSGVQPEGV